MDSNLTLIKRNRQELPGAFRNVANETMSDNDDNRLYDMLWRVILCRNKPIMKRAEWDLFAEHGLVPDYVEPRKNARKAADKLKSWYVVCHSPHTTFSGV